MPSNTPSSVMTNTSFTGFTNFDAAGFVEELKDESNNGRDKYSLTATVKNEGTLWGVTSRLRALGSNPSVVTSNVGGVSVTTDMTWTPNVSKLEEIHLKGCLNARDLCPDNGQTGREMNKDGHLYWNQEATEISVDTRKLLNSSNAGEHASDYEVLVYGLATNTNNILVIDLEGATFSNIADMTISDKGLNLLTSNTNKVILPISPSVKEIPADFMNGSTKIRSICIPSNIQIIRTRAFYTIDYVWTTSGTNDPEGVNTKIDNGTQFSETDDVVYGSTAENFDCTKTSYSGSYTFSSNLKMIETSAFANTQPHVKDVYVLNTVAPECHVDAFNTGMYTGNGGYNPVIKDDIITRDSYKNGTSWITMLHYPRQTTTPNVQRYTDPTRSYSIATGLRDGKGATIYFPNQSEFIRAYVQGTYGYTWNGWDPTRENGGVNNGSLTNTTESWTETNQSLANELYENNKKTSGDVKPYTSFYDVTLGGDNQPSGLVEYYKVNWNETSYSAVETGGNLYPERNTLNSAINETTERDYRGWHQFVLTAYAANTTLEEEPYRSYITDNEWWTICPEFDITYAESAILFGTADRITNSGPTTYPYISKLQYVRRDYGRETIYLSFSKNLNANRETFYEGSKHGVADETTGVIVLNSNHTFNADDVVMKAGVPYLIKPSFSPGAVRQFRIFENDADLDKYKQANPESNVVAFSNSALYHKIHASQSVKGSDQMNEVKAGTYSVPVFVSEIDGEGLEKEGVEMSGSTPKKFTIADINYHRSTKYRYTFVGTFYKSFLPHYSYFLGWDSNNNCAKFFYHNGNFETIDNEMRWANGTGVIVPSTIAADLEDGKFKYSVTPAGSDSQGKDPAQWTLLNTFNDDSFVTKTGSAKQYVMEFESPDVIAEDSGVTAIETIEPVQTKQQPEVYDLQGRKVTTMQKGIYIVGGKKYVVK